MKIKVKTLDHKDQELEISDQATVQELRVLIEEKMGIAVSKQRLIFQGRPLLQASRLLKDCGLKDGLTLHLVERPPNMPFGQMPDTSLNADGFGAQRDVRQVNIMSGEISVIRNELFQDTNTAVALIREAFVAALGNMPRCTSTEIEYAENLPAQNDLTVRLRLRLDPVRQLDSGARNRMMRIREYMRRNSRVMEALENPPFYTLVMSSDMRTDEDRVRFGETLLHLEELVTLPRGELEDQNGDANVVNPINDPVIRPTESIGGPVSDGEANISTSIRDATEEEYDGLLQKFFMLQLRAVNDFKRYQVMIRHRSQMSEWAKVIAFCYEEQMRRVMHRFAHIYHSLSDLSVDFLYGSEVVQPHLHQTCGEPISEIMLTVVFVKPEEIRGMAVRPPRRSNSSGNRASQRMPSYVATGLNLEPDFSLFQPRTPGAAGSTQTAFRNVANALPQMRSLRRLAAEHLVAQSMALTNAPGTTPTYTTTTAAEGVSPAYIPDANVLNSQRTPENTVNVTSRESETASDTNLTTDESRSTPSRQADTSSSSMGPPSFSNIPPGFLGQVIVRTNNADSEVAQQAVQAALNAAGVFASAESGLHMHVAGAPAAFLHGQRLRPSNMSWVRRAYSNRPQPNEQLPVEMYIGPRYPVAVTNYTNDPFLYCQSNLSNPRSNIHNSSAYETLLNDLYQATVRYSASLQEGSRQQREAEALVKRWERVRNAGDSDGRIVVNMRGDAMFTSTARFKTVIAAMLRRAACNLGDCDGMVSRHLDSLHGEYDLANYAMIPVSSPPIPGTAGPVLGTFQADGTNLDIQMGNAEQRAREHGTSRDGENIHVHLDFRLDSMPSAMPTMPVPAETTNRGRSVSSGEVDVMTMINSLQESLRSGRETTLAQIMRNLGSPDAEVDAGFISVLLTMAYELMQLSEIVQLLSGNFTCLDSYRLQMRRFLGERVFMQNPAPSDEDIANAAERVALTRTHLNSFLSLEGVQQFVEIPGIGRVDLVTCVIQLEKRTLEKFFTLIMRPVENVSRQEFCSCFVDIFKMYVRRAIVLANLAVNDTPYGYETLLMRAVENSALGGDRHIVEMMSRISLAHIRNLLHREGPFTVYDMASDLVIAQTENAEKESVRMDETSVAEIKEKTGSSMEVSSGFEENQGEAAERLPQNAVAHGDVAPQAEGKPIRVAETNELPQDWLNIIGEDKKLEPIERLMAHSEAYLSGSAAQKKKDLNAVVEGTTEGPVTKAMRTALIEAASVHEIELSEEMKIDFDGHMMAEFDRMLKERISADPDFDPDKYTECAEFLKKNGGDEK